MWQEMQKMCDEVVFNGKNDTRDTSRWLLTSNGRFTVQSTYLALKMCILNGLIERCGG
jgi:hypothetical protein